MSNIKKKQHYFPQFMIKNWANTLPGSEKYINNGVSIISKDDILINNEFCNSSDVQDSIKISSTSGLLQKGFLYELNKDSKNKPDQLFNIRIPYTNFHSLDFITCTKHVKLLESNGNLDGFLNISNSVNAIENKLGAYETAVSKEVQSLVSYARLSSADEVLVKPTDTFISFLSIQMGRSPINMGFSYDLIQLMLYRSESNRLYYDHIIPNMINTIKLESSNLKYKLKPQMIINEIKNIFIKNNIDSSASYSKYVIIKFKHNLCLSDVNLAGFTQLSPDCVIVSKFYLDIFLNSFNDYFRDVHYFKKYSNSDKIYITFLYLIYYKSENIIIIPDNFLCEYSNILLNKYWHYFKSFIDDNQCAYAANIMPSTLYSKFVQNRFFTIKIQNLVSNICTRNLIEMNESYQLIRLYADDYLNKINQNSIIYECKKYLEYICLQDHVEFYNNPNAHLE